MSDGCKWCGREIGTCDCLERIHCKNAGHRSHMYCGTLPCGCPKFTGHKEEHCPHTGPVSTEAPAAPVEPPKTVRCTICGEAHEGGVKGLENEDVPELVRELKALLIEHFKRKNLLPTPRNIVVIAGALSEVSFSWALSAGALQAQLDPILHLAKAFRSVVDEEEPESLDKRLIKLIQKWPQA